MYNIGNYYRPSGKVHPSYILFFVLGILGTAVLSVIYSIVMYYNPSVYFSVLVAVGYSMLAGFCAEWLTERGKVRNVFVWALSLLVFFAVFTYVHFAAYAAVLFRDDVPVIDFSFFLALLPEPAYLLEGYRDYIVPEGVWTLGSSGAVVSGIPLLAIWAVEHLIVLLMPFFLGGQISGRPFFEETGHWGKETVCPFTWQYQPKESLPELKRAMEQSDSGYFRSFTAGTPGDNRYCQISYYSDPVEELDTRYLSVKNIEAKTDRKGKTKTVTQDIVKNLSVSAAFIAELENAAQESLAD